MLTQIELDIFAVLEFDHLTWMSLLKNFHTCVKGKKILGGEEIIIGNFPVLRFKPQFKGD